MWGCGLREIPHPQGAGRVDTASSSSAFSQMYQSKSAPTAPKSHLTSPCPNPSLGDKAGKAQDPPAAQAELLGSAEGQSQRFGLNKYSSKDAVLTGNLSHQPPTVQQKQIPPIFSSLVLLPRRSGECPCPSREGRGRVWLDTSPASHSHPGSGLFQRLHRAWKKAPSQLEASKSFLTATSLQGS